MSTHEVSMEGKFSTNNHGGMDVPQRNELVVDEEGSQNILEAVGEPPAKRSKIVGEALKNFFEFGVTKFRKIVLMKH